MSGMAEPTLDDIIAFARKIISGEPYKFGSIETVIWNLAVGVVALAGPEAPRPMPTKTLPRLVASKERGEPID